MMNTIQAIRFQAYVPEAQLATLKEHVHQQLNQCVASGKPLSRS